MAGIDRLRKHGVPFHAIAVVTSASLSRVQDLRDFFVDAGVTEVGMNFDEVEGIHKSSSLAGQEWAHQTFFEQMFDLSAESSGRFRVREFANALRLIAHEPASYTYEGQTFPDNAQVIPFAIITVACNGDFSTFSPELAGQYNADYSSFVLGNVKRTGYLEASTSDAFARLWQDIGRGVATCEASCAYFKYCGGGAPVNKLFENNALDSGETLYCRSMLQRPLNVVLAAIERGQLQAASRRPP